MRSKVFSDLVIVYLTLYVGILGRKCELVSAAVDKKNLQSAFDGVSSLVAANTFSESTALTNNRDRQSGDRITVVGTVDGLLHGFDDQNNKKWTADVGGGPLSSYHSSGNLDYSVIPATDGSLLLHSGEGMRKTSVTARMLVEQAPFATQDGLIITSQTVSRVIGVDLVNGRVHQDMLGPVGVGVIGLGADDAKRGVIPGRGAIYDREKSFNKKQRSPFLLGRTDYTLRAFNQITGYEEFNFTYSELRPLHKGAVLLPQVRHGSFPGSGSTERVRGSDGLMSPQPLPLPLISTPEGDLYFSDNNGQVHRTYALDFPAVSAFTVEDVADRSVSSAVRTQAGYSVQTLRLAYRMPGTAGNGAVGICSNSEDDISKTKCLQASLQKNQQSPSGSNVIIVRSLNDGGLYALELSNEINTRNNLAVSVAIAPHELSVSDKDISQDKKKQQQQLLPSVPSSLLALPGPPPSSLLPSVDKEASSTTSDESSVGLGEGTNEFGGGGGSIISHPSSLVADTSLLLSTFERLLRPKGSKMGTPSVTSLGGATRIGVRVKIKTPPTKRDVSRDDDLLSGWIAEEESDGGIEREREDNLVSEVSTGKVSNSLIGNHFVLPHRFKAPPIKRSVSTYEADAHRGRIGGKTKQIMSSMIVNEDIGDDFAGADESLDGQPVSFVDYLLRYKEEGWRYSDGEHVRIGAGWDREENDDRGSFSDHNIGGGGRSPSPSSLPRSFISAITYYLHIIEMIMLRILVFTFSLYVSLYWLRQRGIVLPPPFGSVSDQLLTMLERIVVRPEALLMRTKSFMSMDPLSRDREREGGNYRVGAGVSGVRDSGWGDLNKEEEVDLELVQGGYTSRVGSLLLTADVLGYGSHGTVVLRGSLNGRPVAVKRMMSRFNRAADREVSLLIRSDGHPNVVRYFLRETKNEFVYLALQLCNMSLR